MLLQVRAGMRILWRWSSLLSCRRRSFTGLERRGRSWTILWGEALELCRFAVSCWAPKGGRRLMQETLCRPEAVDLSRHFSYYAFEGRSGALRWKHEV